MSNEVKTKEKVNMDPKYIIKLTVTLFLTCMVVAGILGWVNSITKDKIAAITWEKTVAAMQKVIEADDFSDAMELTDDMTAAAAAQGGTLDAVYEAQSGGQVVGYAINVEASGSQGIISMMVGVSADGSVRLAPEDYARSLYTGAAIDQLLLGMVGSRPHHPHDVEIGMSVWKGLYSLPILRAHHIRFLSEREYLSEDLLFHLDYLAHAGAVAIVPEPLYYYCQNPASLTGVYRADRFAREKRFYEKVSAELALRFPPEVYRPRLDKAFLGRVRRCIAQEAAHNKNSLRNIAAICRDPLVQAVLRELDESQLPRLKRVLHWAIQHHCALFLYGAFRLR